MHLQLLLNFHFILRRNCNWNVPPIVGCFLFFFLVVVVVIFPLIWFCCFVVVFCVRVHCYANFGLQPLVLSVRVLETRSIASNQIFPDVSIEPEFIGDDSIELPRGALIENSEGGLVRIVFVAFERLESILRPLDSTNGEPKSLDDFNEAQGK